MSKSRHRDALDEGPLLIKIEPLSKSQKGKRCSEACKKQCIRKSYTIFDPKPPRKKRTSSEQSSGAFLNPHVDKVTDKNNDLEKEGPEKLDTISPERKRRMNSEISRLFAELIDPTKFIESQSGSHIHDTNESGSEKNIKTSDEMSRHPSGEGKLSNIVTSPKVESHEPSGRLIKSHDDDIKKESTGSLIKAPGLTSTVSSEDKKISNISEKSVFNIETIKPSSLIDGNAKESLVNLSISPDPNSSERSKRGGKSASDVEIVGPSEGSIKYSCNSHGNNMEKSTSQNLIIAALGSISPISSGPIKTRKSSEISPSLVGSMEPTKKSSRIFSSAAEDQSQKKSSENKISVSSKSLNVERKLSHISSSQVVEKLEPSEKSTNSTPTSVIDSSKSESIGNMIEKLSSISSISSRDSEKRIISEISPLVIGIIESALDSLKVSPGLHNGDLKNQNSRNMLESSLVSELIESALQSVKASSSSIDNDMKEKISETKIIPSDKMTNDNNERTGSSGTSYPGLINSESPDKSTNSFSTSDEDNSRAKSLENVIEALSLISSTSHKDSKERGNPEISPLVMEIIEATLDLIKSYPKTHSDDVQKKSPSQTVSQKPSKEIRNQNLEALPILVELLKPPEKSINSFPTSHVENVKGISLANKIKPPASIASEFPKNSKEQLFRSLVSTPSTVSPVLSKSRTSLKEREIKSHKPSGDDHQDSECVLEVLVIAKHNSSCKFWKPPDGATGWMKDYHILSHHAVTTCNGNPATQPNIWQQLQKPFQCLCEKSTNVNQYQNCPFCSRCPCHGVIPNPGFLSVTESEPIHPIVPLTASNTSDPDTFIESISSQSTRCDFVPDFKNMRVLKRVPEKKSTFFTKYFSRNKKKAEEKPSEVQQVKPSEVQDVKPSEVLKVQLAEVPKVKPAEVPKVKPAGTSKDDESYKCPDCLSDEVDERKKA